MMMMSFHVGQIEISLGLGTMRLFAHAS